MAARPSSQSLSWSPILGRLLPPLGANSAFKALYALYKFYILNGEGWVALGVLEGWDENA